MVLGGQLPGRVGRRRNSFARAAFGRPGHFWGRSAVSPVVGSVPVGMNDSLRLDDAAVRGRLGGIRGGLPLEDEQVDVIVRLLEANGRPVRRSCRPGRGRRGALELRPLGLSGLPRRPRRSLGRDDRRRAAPVHGRRDSTSSERPGGPGLAPCGRGVRTVRRHRLGLAFHFLDRERRAPADRPPRAARARWSRGPARHDGGGVGADDAAHEDASIDSLASYRANLGEGGRSAAAAEYRASLGDEPEIGWSADAMVSAMAAAGFESADCYFKHFRTAIVAGRRPGGGPGSGGKPPRSAL